MLPGGEGVLGAVARQRDDGAEIDPPIGPFLFLLSEPASCRLLSFTHASNKLKNAQCRKNAQRFTCQQ